MNKARRIVVAGIGAMTPAFVVMDAAQARPDVGAIAPVQSGATIAPDQEALKSALLGLSPAEKLRIAGDRIRLAKSATKPNVQSTRKGAHAASVTPGQICGPTAATCPTYSFQCRLRPPPAARTIR